MWNWYSGDESPSSAAVSDQQDAGAMSVADLTEQLAQTQRLVAQLKDLIRDKDNDLRRKDQELKEEKESSESKVSKAKLQNKAKIASLSSQLEELKKQRASTGADVKRSEKKKGSGDGDQENASANRGKILVLRKRVEELESQLSLKNEELQKKTNDLEAQHLRGSEMDALLAAKEQKLSEKEAYIVDLQMSAASKASGEAANSTLDVKPGTPKDSNQDLQTLIQNLTRKVGESEERCSLLQEQAESLKVLLNKEKSTFQEKEAMYTENIRVYQNMILEKEKEMKELSQKHDQEIFKLAAKSDASADLHQLLKALKQKLHEEEEVLLGKNQVIDVLQRELDSKDHNLHEMGERCRRLLSEKENLQSKLDAEKHVMRAQLKDMMEKHQTELQRLQEKHSGEIREKFHTIQQLQNQLQGLASPGDIRSGPTDGAEDNITKLQGEVKLKTEEASKSEAKFLKMKAWSKSRIRQLEEELKISEGRVQELSLLHARVTELEEEKNNLEMRLESAGDLQLINEQLLAKLVAYEDQQRKLQADLEQVTKRAESQASESGSVDELQNQLLEWNEMSPDSDMRPDHMREETSATALRMAQIEEEREAMDSGQVEVEEELSAARRGGRAQPTRRKGSSGALIQDAFHYGNKSFDERNLTAESNDSAEGENMGGWWPEFGSPNSGLGLRAVVEELEVERNQLQEQIMTLEERCQELEDRLQLQLRIESLQSENERSQAQLSQLRQQLGQEAEKHYELMSTLNEQLKGLSNRNVFLENAVLEKEQTIQDAAVRLDQLGAVRRNLQEKEALNRETAEKLDQCEQQLEEVTNKQKTLESENSALKLSNAELTEKVSAFKERVFIQDLALEKLQVDLDQTNEELDRLNTSHLEERSQLIYDLQRCEREMDVLKELLHEKDKEMSSLSASLAEYSEQIAILKDTVDFKDGQMRDMSGALLRLEREKHLLTEAQTSDVQETSARMSALSEQLGEMELELNRTKNLNESKVKEAEELIRQIKENDTTIKTLRQEVQAQSVTHSNHLKECSVQVALLKEQMKASVATLEETELKYRKDVEGLRSQLEMDHQEKERLASLLQEKNMKEQAFENELKTAKEQYNLLVSGMTKKDSELEQLSNRLGEQNERCDKLDKELSNKEEELSALREELDSLGKDKEDLKKTLQEKTQEFEKQIGVKSEIISKLDSEKDVLQSQVKHLEATLEDKEADLKTQKSHLEEFGIKVQGLEEHNRHLCNEKENLSMQVSQKESEISAINQNLQYVQRKLVETEQKLSEEKKIMSDLLRDQEEKLLAKLELISAQNLQNDQNITERAKECLNLNTQLREEQEVSLKLRTQIQSLEKDLQESRKNDQEKEDLLKAKIVDYNTVCDHLKQSQDQHGLLQTQLEQLNEVVERKQIELNQKDALINDQRAKVEETKANLEKLRTEEQHFKEVSRSSTEQVESLNMALSGLQQEFNGKQEEIVTLREKLDVKSKEIETLTHERDSTLMSVSKLEGQRDTIQSAVDSLRQQIHMLETERVNLHSSIEQLNTTLASKSEEITVLSSHLSQQGHTILSLKDQIDGLQLEKQTLMRNVEEKETLLFQKEELIHQTEKKLEGEGHYLQTISSLQNELQSLVSDHKRQQQKIIDQEQDLQKLGQQVQLLKDKGEEAGLLKTQLSEHITIISDLHCQVKDLKDQEEELRGALTHKDECLKEKVDSYLNLKAQISEMQDSLEAEKNQVEALMLDNTQYKDAVEEKGLALKNSLLECQELNQKLNHREEQCNVLKKQMADLEEVNAKQASDLNAMSISITEKESSHSRKEETLNAQLEQQSKLVLDFQKTVQELSTKINALEHSVADKEGTVQNLQEKYASLYEQKQELVESLSRKDDEASKLLSSVKERDAKIQVLESNVQSIANEVKLLREQLDQGTANVKNISEVLKLKDEAISQHQTRAEALKVELESLNVEIQETKAQLHILTQDKEERKLFIQSLQEQCHSQNQHIENLKTDLDHLNSRSLEDHQKFALEKEHFHLQLEAAAQEKSRLEALLQTLEVERDSSLVSLQKQLVDKAEAVKDLEAKLEGQLSESEARIHSETERLKLLKAENGDLQKQVSGQTEEIYALKVNLENIERNFSELQQQSQNMVQRVNEQQTVLREQNTSLENEIKMKDDAIQNLLKDMHYVENQLCTLCDENLSEYEAVDQKSGYKSNSEKLSFMLSMAMDYKARATEITGVLEAKRREIDLKSESILSFEKEKILLQEELQKAKEQILSNDSVMEELAVAKETSSNDQRILEEKEKALMHMNVHSERLQEELKLAQENFQNCQMTLDQERAKLLELLEDAKMKDSLVQDLNVQLNQQKELISTLTDQLKERDTSLTQTMESMWNEMATFSEEKKSLNLELQNLQSAKSSGESQIAKLSERLETCETKLQQSEQILADKETSLSTLINEKDLQLEKFSKERENLKRKLQAALVIRKELIQKLESLEQSNQEALNKEQFINSELRRTVEDINARLESIQSENKELQSCVQLARQTDEKNSALCATVSEKESLVMELQGKVTELQRCLSEKDHMCQDYLKTIQEKELCITQTQSAMKEKLKTLEEENAHLVENLENVKCCLEEAQVVETSVLSLQTPMSSPESTSTEGSFSHAENSVVHNNVHASLLCSQRISESKEKHTDLLQSLSNSVKKFQLLQKSFVDLHASYESKCTEYEQQRQQMLTLQTQVQTQQEQLTQKGKELDEMLLEVAEQRQRTEALQKMEYEDVVCELKTSLHEKDVQLLQINSEHEQLLSDNQILKDEMQNLCHDIDRRQEEMDFLKSVVDSKSVELEQYEMMKESMKTEMTLLQKEVEASRMAHEGIQITIQQINSEKDAHFKAWQENQLEVAQLKQNLETTGLEVLEKDMKIRTSAEDMEKMSNNLKVCKEEAENLQADYNQVKSEVGEYMLKLEKATVELSELRTKLSNSRKEDEIAVWNSSAGLLQNPDLNQVVPEKKPVLDNLQGSICKDCSTKQKAIDDLEYQLCSTSKIMEDLVQDHKLKISEESSVKDQIQRKLQAALVSRKDLLKENKALKQKIENLILEASELKQSLLEVREDQVSEITLLTGKSKDLISENERLLLVNENLSAACESLKSTMENIVQEKEAFSFQLNSLKDSQMVELTGWKAKHGELNKEYESLLQAYENISDEIDKMRRVIEIMKKDKQDFQMKCHDLQSENQELAKQFEESTKELEKLRTKLNSREGEIEQLKSEAEILMAETEKTSQFAELSHQNLQLLEENKSFKEACENLKRGLESKEQENNSLFIIKTALDKLQTDMNMYKSDMEIKISEMTSENELLSTKVNELTTNLLETKQSLENSEVDRRKLLENLQTSELLLSQQKDKFLKLESVLNDMHIEKHDLSKKVKEMEEEKILLLEEVENIQNQFGKVKDERECLEVELRKSAQNNSLLSDKFKSLQAQTSVLSQQVQFLRAEKNNIVREKEQHQLQVLRDLEERVKCVQDDNRGTKSKSKELQELLKEKQQEINQLQRDSIRFQELILDLEEALKESNNRYEKDIKKECYSASSRVITAENDILVLNEELTNKKNLLELANGRIDRLIAEIKSLKRLEFEENIIGEVIELEVDERHSQDLNVPKNTHVIHRPKVTELNSATYLEEGARKNPESEKGSVHQDTRADGNDEMKTLQEILTKKDQELQYLKLESGKMKANLQKQARISQHMKEIIDNKDKEISLLISSKDGNLSNYLAQIQNQYRKQSDDYEHRLSAAHAEKEKSVLECRQKDKELQSIQMKYDEAINDKTLISNEIKAFRKSMSSLQTNRDHLSSELQNTHQRNETVLNQKDNIIISTSNEIGALKQELRRALNQVDDLNAENAMLGAQLIRYREDLNQVLSLKDHQLKELLRQKVDHIKNLEQEKCDLQKQNREMKNANETLKMYKEAIEQENQKLVSKVTDQESLIAAINKEKILVESRKKTDSKDLQMINLEEKYKQDFLSVGQHADSFGSGNAETEETTDKTYWDLFRENKELRSRNESFAKAMAALQNNRDSLIDDFKELQWKYASELKTEKTRGDELEEQLDNFKSQLLGVLKNNSLLNDPLVDIENKMTLDQLVGEIDSLCSVTTNKGLEVTRLTSECAAYSKQIDSFSKAMASLQHDREQLLHLLKEGKIVGDSRQKASSTVPQEEGEYLTMNSSLPDKVSQVTELVNNPSSESLLLRTRVQDLERRLQEARLLQEKMEKDIAGYQFELAELRSEKSLLVTEAHARHHQFSAALAEKDRQIAELYKIQESVKLSSTLYGEKGVERMALVGSAGNSEKASTAMEEKEQTQNDIQRYIQELYQRDLVIQQINAKAMESVKINAVLSAELKSVSQGLSDAQIQYTDLQNQYYKLQRDFQTTQVTNQKNILIEVPPGAPQEKANVLVEIDHAELTDLRRRLAEAELRRESTRHELSQVSEKLAEEKTRREEAEEALNLTELRSKRMDTKSSRDYEFSLQMESDDERAALIIDPTENFLVRKVKGGSLSVRRWLRGRSLYCSKLLTTKSKSRYLFLTYLVGIHVLILMCLSGAL